MIAALLYLGPAVFIGFRAGFDGSEAVFDSFDTGFDGSDAVLGRIYAGSTVG